MLRQGWPSLLRDTQQPASSVDTGVSAAATDVAATAPATFSIVPRTLRATRSLSVSDDGTTPAGRSSISR